MSNQKIGLVGLCEAGNFGDDLILVASNQAITTALPDAEVSFTSFGFHLDWPSISRHLRISLTPHALRSTRDLPGSRHEETMLDHCDAIVFGGGGLLQTSHHPQKPYLWLRYLSRNMPTKPVLAAGVGVGPLNSVWQKRLRNIGSPFTECYLRDADSVEYAHNILGWPAERCRDFVDAEFLRQFGVGEPSAGPRPRQLGVAVRAWPGLQADALAQHVKRIAKETDSDSIRFFVLEAPGGRGPDLSFTNDVSSRIVGMPTSVRAYIGSELVDFMRDMLQCHSAISMKLHSSAVWGAAGVPMYPIFYAPKTAILFGQPYRGLEVKNQVMLPVDDEAGVPRAQDVVGEWIGRLDGRFDGSRAVLSRLDTLDMQTRSFVWNVATKAGLTPHARSA